VNDPKYPEWRWEPRRQASVNLGSSGPTRVETDPDPKFKPRPVGFTAKIEPVDPEPLLWDGDGA